MGTQPRSSQTLFNVPGRTAAKRKRDDDPAPQRPQTIKPKSKAGWDAGEIDDNTAIANNAVVEYFQTSNQRVAQILFPNLQAEVRAENLDHDIYSGIAIAGTAGWLARL